MLLKGGTVCGLGPPSLLEGADVRIREDRIWEIGMNLNPEDGEEVVDISNRLLLPGLVCGHHHLYSSLARGMPGPEEPPTNFVEILERVWWIMDRALDEEGVYLSTLIGTMEAVRAGTTTIVDHHSSPSFIEGSLKSQEKAFREVGLRGVLCYEVTDRNGFVGRDAGIEENRNAIERLEGDDQLAALVGAHASFTLCDESLEMLGELAESTGKGVHIHVAEDRADVENALALGTTLIDRLDAFGLLKPGSIFGHGTHLKDEEVARVLEAGVHIAHNCRSNMNNHVGYAPLPAYHARGLLGTDGISGSMFEEAKAAFFKARDAGTDLGADEIVGLLRQNQKRAGDALGLPLGKLEARAPADLICLEYESPTPLHVHNLAWHFIFGLTDAQVTDVMCRGEWILRNRTFPHLDEAEIYARARSYAPELWNRMKSLRTEED